jgi:uncharacterized membrane protein
MPMRSVIGASILVCSTVAGFIPDLWHAGMFSMWGVFFSVLGGFFGLWVGYRINENYGY